MKNWKKQMTAVGLSASLLVTGYSAVHAEVKAPSAGKTSSVPAALENVKKANKKDNHKPLFSDDTLVIKYTKPLTANDHNKAGGRVIRSYSQYNMTVIKVSNKNKFDQAMQAYQKMGKVTGVSPSVLSKTLSTPDPKVNKQYSLSLLQIEKAQKLAGKNAVKVAVIDQGVDRNHSELKGQVVKSVNVDDPMNQALPDFHGTHVSGIIAAKKGNGIGGYGVNPSAKILSYDVFDRGGGAYDYSIADAILRAVKDGAKVINMSLGGYASSPLIEEAVKTAVKANVIIVAAAGNEETDELSYPAAYEGVISVGSTNAKNKLSWYSNYGPSVDIVAPGENVYAPLYDYEKKSTFETMSGTSMATPVVAGTASLILSKYPTLKPAQVEYILEHTTKDLGAKGFDSKYAHGLVQPLAAMKFNVKKIPASVKRPQTEREVLQAASSISPKINKEYAKEGKITKASEERWIKFEVKKGEYIQTFLTGSKNYDLKYKIHLYGTDSRTMVDVDKLKKNGTEGKLFKPPFSGTLAIGVSDVNGNYDDSKAATSRYSLKIKRLQDLPKDKNTMEKPSNMSKFPYRAHGTFTGENEDEDFYTFKVDKPQVVKVKTSGVPGVNSMLKVYAEDPYSDEDPEEGMLSDEESEEQLMEPMFYQNANGYGKGETIVFEAVPGVNYMVSTTNQAEIMDGMFDFFMDESMLEADAPEPSAIPYTIAVENKKIGPDEDGLPYTDEDESPEGELAAKKINVKEYASLKQKERKKSHAQSVVVIMDDEEDEDMIEVQDIVDNALPYSLGTKKTGGLQQQIDEDWFAFTPKQDSIYSFTLGTGEKYSFEVYQLIKEKDENGDSTLELGYVAENMDWWTGELKDHVIADFKKGKKYFIRVSNDYTTDSMLYDPYQFSSKLLVANPNDKNEPNDDLNHVKDLKNNKATGMFSTTGDIDAFYFKAKETGISNVSLTKGTATKALKAKYPSELLQDYYGLVLLADDKNGNRKLDDFEADTAREVYKGIYGSETRGSFQTKKGKGYFLIGMGFFDNTPELSFIPYTLQVQSAMKKDEDTQSVIKGNKPSKPLSLKKINSKSYSGTGYFNVVSQSGGDADWYKWTLSKKSKVKLTLDTSLDIDGVITVYKNGKQVAKSDYYGSGDAEVLYATLGKGTYHIKVKDLNGNASVHAYKLKAEIR
ncbi:S8 family serine peptidase [Fictibacillus enclensis]|uniref:S8 family serine peptidase n=1 Tax=Fictibacillus enclensis TaxID=1017270 RepID=UPI0025A19517|nr:S8 family serine peptidase [Fictibacillus enclensis]MDM5340114.1 S8 family serine peptidase [Fictibacillus enclensis]